jgi:hypothetical protein
VVEYARSVLGLTDANSTEFDPATPHPCVVFMPEVSKTHLGGTMRLGARRTLLQTPDCITARLYQAEQFIDERHRHRYEVGGCVLRALNGKWQRKGKLKKRERRGCNRQTNLSMRNINTDIFCSPFWHLRLWSEFFSVSLWEVRAIQAGVSESTCGLGASLSFRGLKPNVVSVDLLKVLPNASRPVKIGGRVLPDQTGR